MALISLLTDYGTKDAYVANIKAKIWSEIDHINILDISHDVEKFHIPQAAYFLKSNLNFFSKNDIHIIDVCHPYIPQEFIVATSEKGTFIAPDNGILSFLNIDFSAIYSLKDNKAPFNLLSEIVPIVISLANKNTNITDFGELKDHILQFSSNELKIDENTIIGSIIHVDHYGNLITDISKNVIEQHSKNREIEIKVGRERIKRISTGYKTNIEADCIALFNNQELLEIAITDANASKLLGRNFGHSVTVTFR